MTANPDQRRQARARVVARRPGERAPDHWRRGRLRRPPQSQPQPQRIAPRDPLGGKAKPTPPTPEAPADTTAQAVWWGLEDLWLRLAEHRPLWVEREGENEGEGEVCRIVVADFRHATVGAVGDLRAPVFDDNTYHWHAHGDAGAWVRLIDYRGDDLVFTLNRLAVIAAWPDGADLVWQVGAFLLRLQQVAGAARAGRCQTAARSRA